MNGMGMRDEQIECSGSPGSEEVLLPEGNSGDAEQYRHLFEEASDGIVIADEHGVFLDVNESAVRILGFTRDEILGKRIRDLVVAEDVPALEADVATLHDGHSYVRERRMRRKDGTVFTVEVSAKRLLGGRIQGILRDVTARKQAEEMLRQSEERFRSLTAAGFEGISISEKGRIVDANEQMLAMLGYEREEYIGREILSLVGPEWRQEVEERLAEGRGEPMVHRLQRKDGSYIWAEAQSKTIQWQGRARRVTALRDITEQKRTAEALRESEARLSLIFNSTSDMMALVRVEPGPVFRMASMNRAYMETIRRSGFNLQPEDLVGKTFEELFGIFGWTGPAGDALMNRYREAVRTGMELRYEEEFPVPSGRYAGEVVIEPIQGPAGVCEFVLFTSRDITARKRTEAALRESEEKFSKAFRSSPDGISITELETGRFIEVNDGYCQLFGFQREEMLGKTSLELKIWSDPENRRKLVEALRSQGVVRDFMVRTLTRRGKPAAMLLGAELIDFKGRQCIVAVLHDVTDRVRAEESLRENEERFRVVAEQTGQLIYDYDVASGNIRWAGAVEQVTGRRLEEFQNVNIAGWAELIHAEDRERAVRLMREVMRTGGQYAVEYRLRQKDGSYRPVEDHGVSLLDDKGQGRRLLGTIADITARRRAEAERADATRREQQARESYTQQLMASQEAERRKIAGELHDSLGQDLLLVKHRTELALAAEGEASTGLRAQLQGILELAARAIAEVRQISHDLRPYQLDQLGLTGALKTMIEKAANATGVAFEQKLEPVDDVIKGEAATNVYRATQECVNNILKHAEAKRVTVLLERDIRHVRLWIADDGRGFDARAVTGGLGLKSLAERVRILGGTLNVDSAPGKGTRIEVLIPISESV